MAFGQNNLPTSRTPRALPQATVSMVFDQGAARHTVAVTTVSTIELIGDSLNPAPGDQLVALWQWVNAVPDPMRWLGALAGLVEHGLSWNVDCFVVYGKLLDDLAKLDALSAPLIPCSGFSQSRDGKDEWVQQNDFQFGIRLATGRQDVAIVGLPLF